MASSSSSSNYAPASSTPSWKYDVFFSFRGEDTRKTFVDHLYSALVERLIRVYKDDEALPRGDSIGPSLLKAIEESQIAVIVFSKNYADSSWCLNELTYIMKCKNKRGLIVMPIFYDVNPSQVRKQQGDFGEAFSKQEEKNVTKAEIWRKALVEASNLAGWEPKHIANGELLFCLCEHISLCRHESKVIKEIVDKIQDRLFSSNLDADDKLVGMGDRLPDFLSKLEIGSGGVRMIGIWGIGGSGKTTLAFSVYMEISRHFQGHCFIANIREQSKHGLETLQEKVLSTVLKSTVRVHSVEEGKHIIKRRLSNSKVLVILDDVDDLSQLQALAGSHKWFGGGSRIIITTRDEHLLQTHRVDHVSPVRLLSDEEAICLFYRHAYNATKSLKDYETLSLRVISYTAGLPLALKVLGSFLFDKDENEWISAIAKLKDFPNIKIMDILKISYDGLETLQKELFLDIACFFRGESTDVAMEILDACGFHPVIGIKVLQQRALITTMGGKFDMHDLVQEMGHYIVRGEHPNYPEKHSRVWKAAEIENMCLGDSRTENRQIEAIEYSGDLSHLSKIISNMKKLRLLSVIHKQFNHDYYRYAKGPYFLSTELRYFYWKWYSTRSPFPDSFQPTNIVVLKLECSLQKELWKGYKHLPHLKVFELWRMKNLLSTPDFDGLPSLQKLKLMYCDELEEIHPSLGNHRRLEYVSVSYCQKLTMFPTIVRMEKLNTLEIECCDLILEFPEIQANMESLVNLSLMRERGWQLETVSNRLLTRILQKLHLSCLQKLDPREIVGESSTHWLLRGILQKSHLSCLQKLDLRDIGLKDGEIPSDIGELSNLKELDLSRNDFSRLGFSISQLTRLKLLCLSYCERLVELPELPSSVAVVKADRCDSLTTIGDFYKNCDWLYDVSLVYGSIITDGVRLLEFMLQVRAIESLGMILQIEGLEIPKRFLHCLVRWGSRKLQLPENWYNDFSGFIMFFILGDGRYPHLKIRMEQVQSGGMGMGFQCHDVASEEIAGYKRTLVRYVPFELLKHTLWWDETYSAVSISFDDYYKCIGFGLALVPKQTGIAPMQTLTDSPPDFSYYEPTLWIEEDSASALIISLRR